MSGIAFHEKAGRSQVDFLSSWLVTGFLSSESPLSPPFHPHSLMSDFVRSVQVGRSECPSKIAAGTSASRSSPTEAEVWAACLRPWRY